MMSIHSQLYWEHLGVAGALAVSVFVILGLALRLRDTPAPRLHIWAMVGFFAVNTLDAVNSLAYSDVFSAPNAFFRWSDVMIPGFMVSLYVFVRALTSSKPELRRGDVVHLLPFAAGLLCLAPQLALPGDVRRGLVEGAIPPERQWWIDLGEAAFWSVWIVVLLVYGGLCIRRLIRHKRNIRDVFSDLEGKTLRWLDGLVATILLLAGIVIADEVRQLMGMDSLRDGGWSLVFDVALPMAFGVFALRAEPPLPDWSERVLAAPSASDAAGPEEGASRYARSGLGAEDIERFAARLDRRMMEGQLWRDHGLNLRGLAAEIAIAPIHLSEVLNTKLGMTFYDYVNQSRIREACELLIRTDATIIEISETVGFNAKSTFNTSFKKVTDKTPSQWRAAHKP